MLQFITDSPTPEGTARQALQALEGGCRWIQIRMKDATDEGIVRAAEMILPLSREYGATLIIDDRVEIVQRTGADGVHLGKGDMHPTEARRILGKDKILGATVNTLADIKSLPLEDIDYLGAGPFRFTVTKKRLSPILGLEGYRELMTELRKFSDIPVVAIGGITLEDIPSLLDCGVTGIAVSGAISKAENPVQATERLLRKVAEGVRKG